MARAYRKASRKMISLRADRMPAMARRPARRLENKPTHAISDEPRFDGLDIVLKGGQMGSELIFDRLAAAWAVMISAQRIFYGHSEQSEARDAPAGPRQSAAAGKLSRQASAACRYRPRSPRDCSAPRPRSRHRACAHSRARAADRPGPPPSACRARSRSWPVQAHP